MPALALASERRPVTPEIRMLPSERDIIRLLCDEVLTSGSLGAGLGTDAAD